MFESLGGDVLAVPRSGSAVHRAGGEWRESGTPGFLVKPLLEDAASGTRTWLMKVEPGATAALHDHPEIEQVFVIDGTFSDGDGTYGPGDFIVRAPGAMHLTECEGGSTMLLVYTDARQLPA